MSSVEEYKPMTNSNFTTLRDGTRKVDLCIAFKSSKDGEREETKAKNCKTIYENLDQAGLQFEHAKVDKTSVCSILTLLLACDRFIEMCMPRLSCCVRIYSCHFNCTLRNTKKSYLLYDIKHLKTGSILILHNEIPKHVC